MKSPAVPPVNVWFLAGAGGKIIGRGRGLPPAKCQILAGAGKGRGLWFWPGPGPRSTTESIAWFNHCIINLNKQIAEFVSLDYVVDVK